MSLQITFVVLRVDFKVAQKNNPATCHFVLTLGNNIGKKHFQQQVPCLITLDDIIGSDFFRGEIRSRASRLKSMSIQKNRNWLNLALTLQHQVTAAFQANTKATLFFS